MSMDIQSYLIGHLGIVAGIFDALGIGAVIDRALPKQGSKNLPHSIIIKAMILNGLGFTHQRLYLFPNFFMTLPTEKLLGKGISPSDLNDDVVGRTLDAIYEYGATELFAVSLAPRSDGKRMGMIDMHQIGAGYGGHFWYNHTISSTRNNVEAVGKWTPPSTSTGWTRVVVHIPDHGADTSQARYKIWNGTKTYSRVVNQRWNRNTWIDLGVFNLGANSNVTLSNVTDKDHDEDREIDIAWDAIAFVPSTKPTVSMVAFGDSYSAGEGVEPYDSNSDVGRDTPGLKNACHRSRAGLPSARLQESEGLNDREHHVSFGGVLGRRHGQRHR